MNGLLAGPGGPTDQGGLKGLLDRVFKPEGLQIIGATLHDIGNRGLTNTVADAVAGIAARKKTKVQDEALAA